MKLRSPLHIFGTCVALLAIVGCARPAMDKPWAERRRPLGHDLKTAVPPREPLQAASRAPRPKEPTGVLTLRQALALALMGNPELTASSWEVRAAEAKTLQAGLLPNPELELEAEEIAGEGERRGLDAAETTLGLSQLIELGGKRLKRMRVASLEGSLAEWDYETKRLDVLTETVKAFVELLAAQQRVGLGQELVRLAEQTLKSASERVRAGKVPPLEEIRAKVVLATSRIELERTRRELEAGRKSLAALWGSTSPAFERVDGQLARTAPVPSAEQLTRLISQNPDIARWAVAMELRRAAVALEEARRTPDLTVAGGVQHFSESDDAALVVGLSVPLPIFDRNQGGIREAKYRVAKAREERRAAEVRAGAGLANAYQVLASAFAASTGLTNDVLPGAQAAYEAAREGYLQGKFGYLDVLDAQRTLFRAKGQYIDALAAYHKAVADVERLIGQALASVNTN